MTPDEAGFLDRVCASPNEDAPRLIFADWLDERGDPRGEFIRVQVALARLPAGDPRRAPLADREAALLARFHPVWSAPLQGLVGWTEFRRGFVEAVNVDGRTFLRRADDLFRLAPIRHVRFLDVGSNLDRVMAHPQLARLTALTVYGQHIDERLARGLVESPHLDGLRELNIGRNRLGDRGIERLAWSPRFRQLAALDASDNAVGDGGARALAESSNLGGLETLELRRNELTRAGLGYLLGSPTLARLRHLGLGQNHLRAAREAPLPRTGVVELGSLDLSENGLTEDGVHMLIAMPGLGHVARLDLGRNELGNAGAAVLAGWPGAASVRELGLSSNRIGDDGARSLAGSVYFHQLTHLDLRDNPIHDLGAFAFLGAQHLRRLGDLGLPQLGLSPRVRRSVRARYSR